MTRDQYMYLLGVLATALLSWGCDGFGSTSVEVDVEVEDMTEVLVINAEIETGQTAWAQISYTGDIDDPVTTAREYEDNATVSIKEDGGNGEILNLVTTGQYAQKGLYTGSTIRGMEGKTYTMTVVVNKQTYSASHYMYEEPGIGWFAINGMTNKGQYISTSVTSDNDSGKAGKGDKSAYGAYSEEWKVMDPRATRDRYLFEYHVNGVHLIQKDWAIDDNRVVNSTDTLSCQNIKKPNCTGEGLKLFNITINPEANQYLDFRVAKIDKPTYDYYNMYEKIVRGLIGVGSVTPYNPHSNFVGKRTVGNFRAVSFSATVGLAPPTPCIVSKGGTVTIKFAAPPMAPDKKTKYFTGYHLYSGSKSGVDHKSTREEIKPTADPKSKTLLAHTLKPAGTTYYRLQVQDAAGHVSPLSPEVSVTPGKDVDGCNSGSTPTTACGDLKAKCDPKTAKACVGKDKKTYMCSSNGTWTEQKSTSMTCGGVTKKCVSQKTGWCQGEDKQWYECKGGKWEKYGGGEK